MTKRAKAASSRSAGTARRRRPKKTRSYPHKEGATVRSETGQLRVGGQAGDLQGLHDAQGADSESVDELLEEGNALEADVVAGVEDAEGNDEREVVTHEVPEDDIPEEYRERDS